ncbi:MAG: hypothetical protein P4M12_08675 [Gammaproteobacteria bacterium]|nr:hypothetical protein [Gammaproteobacteria bacterium]
MEMFKRILFALIVSISSFPLSIYAADDSADIKREIALFKNQMQNLEMQLASAEQTNTNTSDSSNISPTASKKKKFTKKIKKEHSKDSYSTSSYDKSNSTATPKNNYATTEATQEIISPAISTPLSWQLPDITALIVGGASAGYSKPSAHYGSFNLLDFNPIFLVSYKDIMFLRSAIDFSLDNQGNTQTSLNYVNLNLFLNDYAVLGAGKFDSALGYFGRNLSPAWINRLADAPVGFNSNQAAPQADVGIQLQGGFPLFSNSHANYILYISNGSQGFVDTTNTVINHIATDGYTNNYGNYVIGGRLGFLPIPKLEIGVSAAGGKLVLLNSADGVTVLQRGRQYNALGADISYKWDDTLDLRAEIIQQQVCYQSGSIVPQAERWKAWYLQAAFRIPSTKLEPVVRYGKFTSPISSQQQGQVAFGLDYWIAPSIAAQAEYEINHGQSGSGNDVNLFLIQLAFGF